MENNIHRVQKLISNFGYCSRREAERLIEDGKVRVNGKRITIGDKASYTDKISVNGKVLRKERKIYLMLNKPRKYVTALRDNKYKTVMEFIKVKERVFPVGRLDYNTTGLLLFTNDGDFSNRVMHPRYEIKKTYKVVLDKSILKADARDIEAGVYIDEQKTADCTIEIVSPKIVLITIHEGRNRIVRRIFEYFDYNVLDLERIRVGKLSLGRLPLGHVRILKKKDIDKIF